MTLSEYYEMQLLHKRWKILDHAWDMVGDDSQSEFSEAGFALREVSDISAVINTLGVIRRMYAN
jgi:hypothetical protein